MLITGGHTYTLTPHIHVVQTDQSFDLGYSCVFRMYVAGLLEKLIEKRVIITFRSVNKFQISNCIPNTKYKIKGKTITKPCMYLRLSPISRVTFSEKNDNYRKRTTYI